VARRLTPTCPATDGGVVVVRAGENPAHGEGPQEPSRNDTLGDDTSAPVRRMTVPDLQKRLAEKAVAHPDHRFGDLYDLLTWDTVLAEAADRLLANKGSRTAGLDGIDREKLRNHREHHATVLRQQLADGTYRPTPVKRVYIPKRNGKLRPLGIPTLYDRWVQMALKLILDPIFESDFVIDSHGFRPHRSCHTATAQIYRKTAKRSNKVYWVIEGDIEGFFDHVHHKKLMSLLRRRIRDERLLDLVWRFLRAGVMEGRLFQKTETGTPQGGVLSPLLANIYLDHFDHWFAKRAMLGDSYARDRNRKAGHANFQMVRYADDFVVFSNGTKAETEAFKDEMAAWLADELKLTLSPEKTVVTHYMDGFDFLGFTLKKVTRPSDGLETIALYPSTESVKRAVQRIKDLTARETLYNNPADQVEALNAFLRGWGEYFRHSAATDALSYIGHRATMRMGAWLYAKHGKKNWRTVKAMYYREGGWQAGNHRLMDLQTMKVDYPKDRTIPHPYLQGRRVPDAAHIDPFRSKWDGRQQRGADWRTAKEEVWESTGGTCAICGKEAVETHHVKARQSGGSNATTNLVPLCKDHHQEAHRGRNNPVRQLIGKKPLGSGEPDALKGARPVRGGGL
jgi:RNA-directed DNA polymerase